MAKIWTKEKIAVIQTYLEMGITYEEIAIKMDKSVDSIDHAIRRYKLKKYKQTKENKAISKHDDKQEKSIIALSNLDDKNFDDYKKKAKLKWNVKKSTIKPKEGRAFQSYIVIGDVHVPEHNMVPIKAILHMMDDVKFDGMINLGDFCYSEDTEVLTPNGWKKFYELRQDEEILSYDRDKKEAKYRKPVKYQEFDYTGKLINFVSKKIDLLVSPEHKMLYKVGNKEKVAKAWELACKKEVFSLPVAANFNNNLMGGNSVYNKTLKRNLKIPIAMIRLIGWIITEGWLEKIGNYKRVATSQSVKVNLNKCKMIDKCIKDLKFNPTTYINKYGVKTWRFNKEDTKKILPFFETEDVHQISRDLLNLSKKELNELFKVMMLGDGSVHKHTKSKTYATTNKRLMEQFCELAHKLNYSTSVSKIKKREIRHKTCYTIFMGKAPWSKVQQINTVNYKGKIYDVSLFGAGRGGWIFIRRNNKIMISGNCDLGCISHWNKTKKLTSEGMKLKEDYIIGNAILDEFDKRLPADCDKHFMYGNHECIDDKTELLTKRGWITYKDIKKSDKVYSFNPDTECGEWVNIEHVLIKPFTGMLNRINSNVIDLLATDDHKIFSKNRLTNKYEYVKMSELGKKRYLIPVNGNSKNKKDHDITDEMLKAIGWILTDGSINARGYIFVYQSEEKAHMVRKALSDINVKFTEASKDRDIKEICGVPLKTVQRQYTFYVVAKDSRKLLKILDRGKQLPTWVSKLSNRQFEVLLQSLIDGDGSRHISSPETSLMLYGKKPFLEEVQLQCITHNVCASLSTYREKQYRLNITKRLFFNFENVGGKITKEYYNGDVWDLTVPNHNFMIRRNGKCHFTGNSWVYDFLELNPMLEGMLLPINELHLKERGYQVYEHYNEIFRIGKLNFTHGIYCGLHYVKKHIDECKTNIIFAHLHSQRERYEASPAKQLSIAGYAIGCLCSMSPDYMKKRPNKWTNGFAVVNFYADGNFDVQLIRIVYGKFIFNGKIYDGNK